MIVHFLIFQIFFIKVLRFHNTLIPSQKLLERLMSNLKLFGIIFVCVDLRAASLHLALGTHNNRPIRFEDVGRLFWGSLVSPTFIRSRRKFVSVVSNFLEYSFKFVGHIIVLVIDFLINLLEIFITATEFLNLSILPFEILDQFLNLSQIISFVFFTLLL